MGKVKIWEAALLIAMSITLCAGSFWSRGAQALEQNVIRLHVVAVSDEESEQKLKLRVRDEVLEVLKPMIAGSATAEEAEERILSGENALIKAAEAASEGRKVALRLDTEPFPTTESGGLTLPAGSYKTLRLTIGEGRGHNWWGVVFPDLTPDPAGVETFNDGVKVVEDGEGRVVRFWFLEMWERVFS